MPYSSDIVSKVTGKKYVIATKEDRRVGTWTTTVSERRFLRSGVVFTAGAMDEDQARLVHFRVEQIVRELPPADWEHAKIEILKAVVTRNVGELQKPPKREATALVEQGKIGEAIVLALAQRAGDKPVVSPEFEADLKQHWREDHANVVRSGYYVRIIELELVGGRVLIPLGDVDKVLRSDKSRVEKVEAITDYLDKHDVVGLGDPIAPYVFAPIEELRSALGQVVDATIEASRFPEDERDKHNEILHRYLAYGYVRRVAEELVERGPFPTVERLTLAHSEQPRGEASKDDPKQRIKWEDFYEKPNTAMTLAEKARIVAALIAKQWDSSSQLAAASLAAASEGEPHNPPGEKEIQQAKVETAIVMLRMLDEIAFRHLGADDRDTFMEVLEADVAQALRVVGVEPEAFWQVLKERYNEYAQYRWLDHNMDDGFKGLLPWEFALKIATLLGVGPDALFNMLLMKNLSSIFVIANLPELLQGKQIGG